MCSEFAFSVDTVTMDVRFFRAPLVSLVDLVGNPKLLLEPQRFEPVIVSLSYSKSAPPFVGGFKIAYPGYTNTPLFKESSTKVCLKQCYYMNPGSSTRKIYENGHQAELLTMDLNCIGWAAALMTCVYDFMDEKEPTLGQPPFDVPQMHYVQAGLAVSKTDDPAKAAFLIEEYIEADASSKEWFVKYLNNNSAKARIFTDEEKSIRAEFLSFAQHVQFWRTEGLAFVSDLQGMRQSMNSSLFNY